MRACHFIYDPVENLSALQKNHWIIPRCVASNAERTLIVKRLIVLWDTSERAKCAVPRGDVPAEPFVFYFCEAVCFSDLTYGDKSGLVCVRVHGDPKTCRMAEWYQ